MSRHLVAALLMAVCLPLCAKENGDAAGYVSIETQHPIYISYRGPEPRFEITASEVQAISTLLRQSKKVVVERHNPYWLCKVNLEGGFEYEYRGEKVRYIYVTRPNVYKPVLKKDIDYLILLGSDISRWYVANPDLIAYLAGDFSRALKKRNPEKYIFGDADVFGIFFHDKVVCDGDGSILLGGEKPEALGYDPAPPPQGYKRYEGKRKDGKFMFSIPAVPGVPMEDCIPDRFLPIQADSVIVTLADIPAGVKGPQFSLLAQEEKTPPTKPDAGGKSNEAARNVDKTVPEKPEAPLKEERTPPAKPQADGKSNEASPAAAPPPPVRAGG